MEKIFRKIILFFVLPLFLFYFIFFFLEEAHDSSLCFSFVLFLRVSPTRVFFSFRGRFNPCRVKPQKERTRQSSSSLYTSSIKNVDVGHSFQAEKIQKQENRKKKARADANE